MSFLPLLLTLTFTACQPMPYERQPQLIAPVTTDFQAGAAQLLKPETSLEQLLEYAINNRMYVTQDNTYIFQNKYISATRSLCRTFTQENHSSKQQLTACKLNETWRILPALNHME